MKKFLLTLSLLLSLSVYSFANNDFFDVKNYTISLDFTEMSNSIISGNTTISLTTLPDFNNTLNFDLLGLTVDSVVYNNVNHSFSYDNKVIEILTQGINANENLDITVYYHGQPLMGGNSFGGFYFSNGYAFNMGVSLYDIPHNYGKVWFPCVDNFTDKAKYHFFIITNPDNTAVCNGELLSIDTLENDNKIFEWRLNEEIPTYLASVAVANFQIYEDVYHGINRDIPISIYAVNISNVASSFENLKSALAIFEEKFGEYKWERVGYVVVPFNGGAMEHATNISVGTGFVNGTISYEDIFYHELAHHWFGDLITCSSAEDMWINEGITTYCETIFREFFYGKDNAKSYRRNAHFSVIKDLKYEDGAFLPISPMSLDLTYSSTVYDKGAEVTHALRSYLGDSLFFYSLKEILENNQFKNFSSESLRDSLSFYSNMDLTDFFQDWVFTGGFVHYEIDSVQFLNPSSCKVFVRQKLKGRDSFANSNRVEITFIDSSFNKKTEIIQFDGEYGEQIFNFDDFEPIRVFCDFEERTSDANIDFYKFIKSTGTYQFDKTYTVLYVDNVSDSVLIRVTQSLVQPDEPIEPLNGLELLNNRYWSIEGIINDSFDSRADFTFNRSVAQHLDYEYINGSVDSLVLLYRPNKSQNWAIDPDATLNKGLSKFTTDSLKLGEYCIAMKNGFSSVNIDTGTDNYFNVFPNPTFDNFVISFENEIVDAKIQIFNSDGKKVLSKKLRSNSVEINTTKFKSGTYLIDVFDNITLKKYSSKLIIRK